MPMIRGWKFNAITARMMIAKARMVAKETNPLVFVYSNCQTCWRLSLNKAPSPSSITRIPPINARTLPTVFMSLLLLFVSFHP